MPEDGVLSAQDAVLRPQHPFGARGRVPVAYGKGPRSRDRIPWARVHSPKDAMAGYTRPGRGALHLGTLGSNGGFFE